MEAALEKLKKWNFPLCDLEDDHQDNQLNKICVDQRCKKQDLMSPLCVICEEYEILKIKDVQSKPLKIVLKDLIKQSFPVEQKQKEEKQEEQDLNEQFLLKLAQDYNNLSQKCLKLCFDIFQSLEIYKQIKSHESPQKIATRKILSELLFQDEEENQFNRSKLLREKMSEIRKQTIIQNEQIKINEELTLNLKKTVLNNTEKYINVMTDASKKIELLINQIQEISVMESAENLKLQNHTNQIENSLFQDPQQTEKSIQSFITNLQQNYSFNQQITLENSTFIGKILDNQVFYAVKIPSQL